MWIREKNCSCFFKSHEAAYDHTVWRERLVTKLREVVCNVLKLSYYSTIWHRRSMHQSNFLNGLMKLNHELLHVFILAQFLFNIYVYDIPNTTSKKFWYTNNISIATRNLNLDQAIHSNKILNYYKWKLKILPTPMLQHSSWLIT